MKLRINIIDSWADSKNNWSLKPFINSPICHAIKNGLIKELVWVNQLRIYQR